MIFWNKSMSTGLSLVDEQHKELIKQLNNLNQAMTQGRGKEKISEIFDFLGQYAKRHFRDEEMYMESYNCPAKLENKEAHALFIDKFTTLKERFEQEGASSSLAIEIHRQLVAWLIKHIKQVDTKLYPCVKPDSRHIIPNESSID